MTGPMTSQPVIRIGGASAMWGDSAIATPQLLEVPGLNYLTYDYLAESTMAILAKARTRQPGTGYATDFVATAMADNLARIAERGVKVLSNAGGLDPEACREAVESIARRHGISISIAVVRGDDVLALVDERRSDGWRDLDGQPIPADLLSANAYLGARAIQQALARGADMVITGRVVDSAFTVAALVHEFAWQWDDWDRLAQATLAGHIIECGAQACGGLYTDWWEVPNWDAIGYPIVECQPDGDIVVTKPDGTGGLVSPSTVAEQILYEIGDPAAYDMPDVRCDLRGVSVISDGPNRVRVTGARGLPPPLDYKVTATVPAGFRLDTLTAIRGMRALAKAERTADALLTRTRRMMAAAGFEDYTDTLVEPLGTETMYGPHARSTETREIVLRIAVRHRQRAALEFLRREVTSSGVSMGPGTRGHLGGGRATIGEVVRSLSFALPRAMVTAELDHGGRREEVVDPHVGPDPERRTPLESPPSRSPVAGAGDTRRTVDLVPVPLMTIAHGRSGDKGNSCNIGIVARSRAAWAWLQSRLTADAVALHMAHLIDRTEGSVERYELPELGALNFVLRSALGGGGMASLRSDPLGKSFAQILLDMPIDVPPELATPQEHS